MYNIILPINGNQNNNAKFMFETDREQVYRYMGKNRGCHGGIL